MRTLRVILCLLGTMLWGLAQSDEELELVPLDDRLYDVYFKSPPNGLLLDPQRLLRGVEARESREFLDYYSGDSRIDLRVLLFKEDQLLIRNSTATSLHEDWATAEKPVVVIYYYMGQPERSELHLSPQLQKVVPQIERSRTLASCIEWAKSGLSPADQLEKFMVQMSIRVDRMARLLSEGMASPAPLISESAKTVDEGPSALAALVEGLAVFWAQYKVALIGGSLGLVLVVGWRRHCCQSATYKFPDHDAVERLGGAHGAGIGGVIGFSKTSLPPAAQRERI